MKTSPQAILVVLIVMSLTFISIKAMAAIDATIHPCSNVSIYTVDTGYGPAFNEYHVEANTAVDQNFRTFVAGGSPGQHRFISNESLGILGDGEKWHWSDMVLIREHGFDWSRPGTDSTGQRGHGVRGIGIVVATGGETFKLGDVNFQFRYTDTANWQNYNPTSHTTTRICYTFVGDDGIGGSNDVTTTDPNANLVAVACICKQFGFEVGSTGIRNASGSDSPEGQIAWLKQYLTRSTSTIKPQWRIIVKGNIEAEVVTDVEDQDTTISADGSDPDIVRDSSGNIYFEYTAILNRLYEIELSTDLEVWNPYGTQVIGTGARLRVLLNTGPHDEERCFARYTAGLE